jgi:hypothetical protein
MTASRSQGEIGIERICQLAGISRSSYYRHWQLSAPRQEETGLRDAIQRLALNHRHYGYRWIGAQTIGSMGGADWLRRQFGRENIYLG